MKWKGNQFFVNQEVRQMTKEIGWVANVLQLLYPPLSKLQIYLSILSEILLLINLSYEDSISEKKIGLTVYWYKDAPKDQKTLNQ